MYPPRRLQHCTPRWSSDRHRPDRRRRSSWRRGGGRGRCRRRPSSRRCTRARTLRRRTPDRSDNYVRSRRSAPCSRSCRCSCLRTGSAPRDTAWCQSSLRRSSSRRHDRVRPRCPHLSRWHPPRAEHPPRQGDQIAGRRAVCCNRAPSTPARVRYSASIVQSLGPLLELTDTLRADHPRARDADDSHP
jgi:hypothetical protein